MTDHKTAAEHNLSPEFADPRNQPHAAGQEALIHAVLYLADQHRIANLIAYTCADGNRPSYRVTNMIVEGLGIA